jgi:hypothetical protein
VLLDWDASGWQNFVSDPEVPPILQEAGHKGRPQAAELGGQYDSQRLPAALASRLLGAKAVVRFAAGRRLPGRALGRGKPIVPCPRRRDIPTSSRQSSPPNPEIHSIVEDERSA